MEARGRLSVAVGRTPPPNLKQHQFENNIASRSALLPAASRHQRTRSAFAAGLLARAHALRRGSCDKQRAVLRVEPPAMFCVRAKALPGVSRQEQRSGHTRHQQRPGSWPPAAHMPGHTSSAAESGALCRWHDASATSSAAKNRAQRVWHGAIAAFNCSLRPEL